MRAYGIVILTTALLAGCADRRASNTPVPPPPAGPPPIYTGSSEPGLIPAGTTLEIRTNEEINADSAAEGRTYPAELARDVVDTGGKLIAPKGSPAQLVVMKVTDGGRVTSGQIELGLRSLTVNGQTYLVETATSATGERGLGKNRRTAEMVGGGAVLGTVLGAAAGGGKGAAIGALAGAAAGAAAQVLTKGKEVRVPVETVLNFRLDQPVRLAGTP